MGSDQLLRRPEDNAAETESRRHRDAEVRVRARPIRNDAHLHLAADIIAGVADDVGRQVFAVRVVQSLGVEAGLAPALGWVEPGQGVPARRAAAFAADHWLYCQVLAKGLERRKSSRVVAVGPRG